MRSGCADPAGIFALEDDIAPPPVLGKGAALAYIKSFGVLFLISGQF